MGNGRQVPEEGERLLYIDKSLGTETVIARAQFHWFYTLSAWLALILLGWLLIGIWIFFSMMICKWTTEIGVTSHRFVEEYRPPLSCTPTEIALPNIEGVKVDQSLLGRIFGFGTVRLKVPASMPITTRPFPIRSALCQRHPDRQGACGGIDEHQKIGRSFNPLRPAPGRGQDDGDAGARAPRAVDRQSAAMQIEQRLGERQAEAGAFVAPLQPAVDLTERLERDLDIGLRHTNAGIAHRDGDAGRAVLRAERHGAAAAGEFDRVGQRLRKICLSLAASPISGNSPIVATFKVSPAALHCSRIIAAQSARISAMSSARASRRILPDLAFGEIEYRIDHRQQMAAAAQDVVRIIAIARIAQPAEDFAGDDFGKADDRIERGAQFVAHIGEKAGLGGVGRFGLALGALRDSSRSLIELKSDRKTIEPPSLVALPVIRSQRPSASSSSAWPEGSIPRHSCGGKAGFE